jgi:hypothetical protein
MMIFLRFASRDSSIGFRRVVLLLSGSMDVRLDRDLLVAFFAGLTGVDFGRSSAEEFMESMLATECL